MTWACGDLHLENFGSYKGDNRLVYFDINDFDEAALAPATWDLIRSLTSIVISAQQLLMPKAGVHAIAVKFIEAYVTTLSTGKALWIERDTSHGVVRDLLDQVRHRLRSEFLDRRTELHRGRRRFRLDAVKTLKVTVEQRQAVNAFVDQFARTQEHPEFYKVIDVARRIAGTGSLGIDRFAILVEGRGSPDRNYLLDLKQALTSTVAHHWPAIQPRWPTEADRIFAIQQRMQAVPMAFLHAVQWKEASYILRALQPAEDRVNAHAIEHNVDSFLGLVHAMGQCLASAQLRSTGRQGSADADQLIEFASRKKWTIKVVQSAFDMAASTRMDWLTYCEAYDSGYFSD